MKHWITIPESIIPAIRAFRLLGKGVNLWEEVSIPDAMNGLYFRKRSSHDSEKCI